MKLNEKSEFTVDLKLIILVVSMVISLSATYFTLQADIEEAKNYQKCLLVKKSSN